MKQNEALEVLKSGKNVFLTGEAGSGKTYTINLFTDWLREEGVEYAITASTGIAATHVNGMTIHAWAGLGIKRKITENHLQMMAQNDFLMKRIDGAQVLIIDEVSMLDATTINNVDFVLRSLRGNEKPFGGLQIVFVGDFFQLPPVVTGNEKMLFAFESWAWGKAAPAVCYLTEQHRQEDPLFLGVLNALRRGDMEDHHIKTLQARMNSDVNEPDTHLYTHNIDVDRMNATELGKLEGEEVCYYMKSEGVSFLVDMLKRSCLSPDVLKLKIGAVVMFTRNNFEIGYVNGTLGTIIDFCDNGPIVKTNDGRTIYAEHADWTMEENGFVKASLRQYPLRLAWAITVHKSQGMSLDAASMDLSRVFEYGQGYVALSRVRSLTGLHLRGLSRKAFSMHPKVVEQDKIFRNG